MTRKPQHPKPGRSRRPRADQDLDKEDRDETVGSSWDQPQPRYPAPERPRDRADEREGSA